MIIGMLAPLAVAAQDVFQRVISEIEQNNIGLQRMEQELRGRILEEKVRQMPSGPEVEAGYAVNGDRGEARRRTIEVKQELPTMAIFGMNRRYNRSMGHAAALELEYAGNNVRREAERLCIEWIFFSRMEEETEKRVKEAGIIENGEKLKLEKGEGNRIDYNNARLDGLRQQTELERIRVGKERAAKALQELNGGRVLNLERMEYPNRELPENFEQWYVTRMEKSPEILYSKGETEREREKVRWMKGRMIPDLVAGYSYESAGKEKNSGVTLGLRIPLWREKKELNVAKWSYQARRLEEKERMNSVYCKARDSYERCVRMQKMLTKLRNEVESNNNPALISKSMRLGNISMSEYITQMSIYYETINRMFEVEKEMQEAISLLYLL